MAIKASDQISVVDLTDGYSVILTNDSYTFAGGVSSANAGSTTTTIIAMCGPSFIPASVSTNDIVKPNGVTVYNDQDPDTPTLTISVDSSVSSGGVVDIPVIISGNIEIHKQFTFQIAFKGQTGSQGPQGNQGPQGAQGQQGIQGIQGNPGADAITMTITSSAGTIFKNTAIVTTLTAHVYMAGEEVTGNDLSALGTITWYVDGVKKNTTGSTYQIGTGDVTNKAVIVAQLEVEDSST